jgi:hypothetical protein
VPAEEPVVTDSPIADHVETDADLTYDESLGEEGRSDAPLQGPSTNPHVGLGGGSGGAFRGRGGDEDLTRGGGNEDTEAAVEDALEWLAAHQSPSGAWEAEGFGRWCNLQPVPQGPDGKGGAAYDPGVTGLALCAFLGAGYTHRGRHRFARVVARGLQYLRSVQDAEGCFGPRVSQHFVYNHATAALAMVEAYGMTGSPIFRSPAQRALDFVAIARNPYATGSSPATTTPP